MFRVSKTPLGISEVVSLLQDPRSTLIMCAMFYMIMNKNNNTIAKHKPYITLNHNESNMEPASSSFHSTVYSLAKPHPF